jgi:hypothetical protein
MFRPLKTRLAAALLLLPVLLSPARADERVRPAAVLLREGYKPVARISVPRGPLPPAHALAWPVRFQDPEHTLGNVMAQFQPFGDPYYHGGDDLRVNAGADIAAPVGGGSKPVITATPPIPTARWRSSGRPGPRTAIRPISRSPSRPTTASATSSTTSTGTLCPRRSSPS